VDRKACLAAADSYAGRMPRILRGPPELGDQIAAAAVTDGANPLQFIARTARQRARPGKQVAHGISVRLSHRDGGPRRAGLLAGLADQSVG